MKKFVLFLLVISAGLMFFAGCGEEENMQTLVFEHFRPVDEDGTVSVGDVAQAVYMYPQIQSVPNLYIGMQMKSMMSITEDNVVSNETSAGQGGAAAKVSPSYEAGEANAIKITEVVFTYEVSPDFTFDSSVWGKRRITSPKVIDPGSIAIVGGMALSAAAAEDFLKVYEANKKSTKLFNTPIFLTAYAKGKTNDGREVESNKMTIPIHFNTMYEDESEKSGE